MTWRDGFLLFHTDAGGAGSGTGGGTGDAGSGTQATQTQGGQSGTQGGDGGSKDDLVPKREVQEANREAQNLRERLRAAEKERDDLKTAQMSDTEKITEENQTLKQTVTSKDTEIRDLRVQVLAQKVGIVDPEAASRLLDWDSIKRPEDGTEVEKALRKLLEDKPYLAGNHLGRGDGGAGTGQGTQTGDMNTLIRQAAGRA